MYQLAFCVEAYSKEMILSLERLLAFEQVLVFMTMRASDALINPFCICKISMSPKKDDGWNVVI